MEVEQETELPIYNWPLNEEFEGDFEVEEGLAVVMKKTLLLPKHDTKEDWLRTKVSYTTCSINGRVIIDGASSEFVVSQEVIDKFNLKIKGFHHPHKHSWF